MHTEIQMTHLISNIQHLIQSKFVKRLMRDENCELTERYMAETTTSAYDFQNATISHRGVDLWNRLPMFSLGYL